MQCTSRESEETSSSPSRSDSKQQRRSRRQTSPPTHQTPPPPPPLGFPSSSWCAPTPAERVRDEEAVPGEGPPRAPGAGGRRGGAAGRRAGAGVRAHRGGPGGAGLPAAARAAPAGDGLRLLKELLGALGCYKSFCGGAAYEGRSREATRLGSRCTAAVGGAPGGCWIGRE
jgi:hypothetical protein